MLTEVLALLLVFLVVYLSIPSKPKGLPPGLWGWPVVGSLPKKGISVVQQVKKLSDEHGDLVTWRMGSSVNVFLCSYNLIKQVFSKAETADRPDRYSFQSSTLFTGKGVINSNGTHWRNNRRFILRHLKDLGFGKSSLEEAIVIEAQGLVKDLEKQVGTPQPLPWAINVHVINVLWKMVAGVRFEANDSKIVGMTQASTELLKAFEGATMLLDFFPWLVPIIPDFMKKIFGMDGIYKGVMQLNNTFTDVIDDHMVNLDPENPKNLIDTYLIEMKEQQKSGTHDMSILDLQIVLSDLFIAGSDTTSNSLRWSMLYMAKYPEIQQKAQKEIDSVVPRDRLPSLTDKDRLPYTEALTFELFRHISLTALGAPHLASEDIHISGYTIPKGATIFAHLYCCNYDTKYWNNPDKFQPENFLDDDGSVSKSKEGYAPFSLGRRSCLGENLAKMEFFIFLSALLQKFTFSAPPGEEISTERDPKEMILNLPKDVKLILHKRK